MDLQPYLSAVGEDLTRATALADDHTREVAARVATAAEPALRLALVQALSDAAAAITAQLDGAVVSVRMDGRDPQLRVEDLPGTADPRPVPDEEDGGSADLARVTVRLPEALKRQAEGLAAEADQSLNTWIVGAVRRATSTRSESTSRTHSRRITGWA